MIYPIVVYGDPVLRKRAADIEKGSDVKQLVLDMFETMRSASGIGLAAPQIGMSIRLFVVDGSPLEEPEVSGFRKVFINAKIVERDGKPIVMEEGCLSIPGVRDDVQRPNSITVNYYDEHWKEYTETYEGMKARIIQHEYDHIEGVLFTDHLTAFKKRIIKNKLVNISRGKVSADYRLKIPVKR
ncbi:MULTISPECIES: peptide deformylase [unclassified Imperialibacter]|jgi:peptide deformylase|uniref:peptide deformylase n=1 Tax=unclassified Imperialibacter TaxID=2629706 RepID=UPI00125BECCB|nr:MULTISPECIES: peptide deformylase [unclassified Imperialibacter]CAD5248046.1 Peptide deformylase [Imperialibacter sp. 75]CAD5248155.1 Peptide deformylase [Imperialibacter sp. 89]VVS97413.1 Peptide deformylase [Imperialibacter sp. EC-SDR9]